MKHQLSAQKKTKRKFRLFNAFILLPPLIHFRKKEWSQIFLHFLTVPPPGSMKAARVEEFDLIDVSASSQAMRRPSGGSGWGRGGGGCGGLWGWFHEECLSD